MEVISTPDKRSFEYSVELKGRLTEIMFRYAERECNKNCKL